MNMKILGKEQDSSLEEKKLSPTAEEKSALC